MSSWRQPCRRCGTAKGGRGWYCVACYRALCTPCPYCTYCVHTRLRVKQKPGRGAGPVDCEFCHNERFILTEPKA